MFIVENYGLAILLCVVTMLCWGSWANTTKLTSKHWRFEFFYWDYGFGILLTTIAVGFYPWKLWRVKAELLLMI